MATIGNLDWAYREASRRADKSGETYSIYQNPRRPEDHIIRLSTAPAPQNWPCIHTVGPMKPLA